MDEQRLPRTHAFHEALNDMNRGLSPDVRRGIELRDQAIERVSRPSRPWIDRTYKVIERMAEIRPTFTTDDVWKICGDDQPDEPRAMGALMRLAVNTGIVATTDRVVNSKRPECHRRPVRVYRSLKCGPQRTDTIPRCGSCGAPI